MATSLRAAVVAAGVAFLTSCSVKRAVKPPPVPTAATSSEVRFQGVLSCPNSCDGVETELTLNLVNRRFRMREVFVGTPDGDVVVESRGEWSTLKEENRGVRGTIYELTSEAFDHERYFLKMGGDALQALDDSGKPLLTNQNVVLMRVQP